MTWLGLLFPVVPVRTALAFRAFNSSGPSITKDTGTLFSPVRECHHLRRRASSFLDMRVLRVVSTLPIHIQPYSNVLLPFNSAGRVEQDA